MALSQSGYSAEEKPRIILKEMLSNDICMDKRNLNEKQ